MYFIQKHRVSIAFKPIICFITDYRLHADDEIATIYADVHELGSS